RDLMRRSDQQELRAAAGQTVDDGVQRCAAFIIQTQERIIEDQHLWVFHQRDGKLKAFVLAVGQLDQWFLQQGENAQVGGKILACPAAIGKFLCNGNGLVRIGGVETLLVIQIVGPGAVPKTVLLFYDGDTIPRRTEDAAGGKMETQQRVC